MFRRFTYCYLSTIRSAKRTVICNPVFEIHLRSQRNGKQFKTNIYAKYTRYKQAPQAMSSMYANKRLTFYYKITIHSAFEKSIYNMIPPNSPGYSKKWITIEDKCLSHILISLIFCCDYRISYIFFTCVLACLPFACIV